MSDDLAEFYARQMAEALPEGPAWQGFRDADGQGRKLLSAKAAGWAAVHARLDALMAEILPWRAMETLPARETEAGLPDTCTKGRTVTLAERRQAVGERWGGVGFAHRPDDFEAAAAQLGYSVTTTTSRPARLGLARCGDRLNPAEAAFHLRTTVHGPRITPARLGLARCGDRLTRVERAADLECRLAGVTHSHAVHDTTYEEA